MPRLLIIGCGRSGTRYVTKVMGRAGLVIGHEIPAKDGMASWVSLGTGDVESHDVIWHQVREPVGVISSFHTVMKRTWKFIYEVEPRIDTGDPLTLRCMKYWLYWNERCEQAASRTYRVEAVLDVLPELLAEMGAELRDDALAGAAKVSTNDHTRRQGHKVSDTYPKVGWADLEAADATVVAQIRAQAERYGYEFPKIGL